MAAFGKMMSDSRNKKFVESVRDEKSGREFERQVAADLGKAMTEDLPDGQLPPNATNQK